MYITTIRINVNMIYNSIKTFNFMQDVKNLKRKFAALNSENRLKILFLCLEKGRNITELSKLLKLSHSKTSDNASILEREGLVKKTRKKDNTVDVKTIIEISDTKLRFNKKKEK